MSAPVHREPIRFNVQEAPQAPSAAAPRRPAPAARDTLDPPPENPAPRRRSGEGCGICSLICRCIADLFRAIFRYFCPPPLNPNQRRVAAFLHQFPPYIEDESSVDRREEFWNAFRRLPVDAQRAARDQVYLQHRANIIEEVERTPQRSASGLERKKAPVAIQHDPLSDAINDAIDNFIRNNHYNDAVRTALNRFIGRVEVTRDEE